MLASGLGLKKNKKVTTDSRSHQREKVYTSDFYYVPEAWSEEVCEGKLVVIVFFSPGK